MSGRGDAWAELGIDVGTSDARTVKRAYAQKLKSIDVDADPVAFIALRAAMEQALDELRWHARPDRDEDVDGASWVQGNQAADPPVPHSRDGLAAIQPVGGEKARDPLEVLNDYLRIMSDLLFGEHDSEKAKSIGLCWQDIVANPVLDRIDILADVEQWFAGVIAESLPRSDPLIWPAIKLFGWTGDDQRWNGDGRVAAILRRQRDLYFLHQLAQPGNLLNYALDLLHQWPDEVPPKARRSKENGVRILLRSIRYLFPTAEWNFDEGKVQAWINHLEAPPTGLLSKFGSGDGHPVFEGGAVFDGTSVIAAATTAPESDGWVDESTPAIVWLGMVLVPFVACWWTLRKGYSFWGRFLTFGWAAIFVIAMIPEQSKTGHADQPVDPGSLEFRVTNRLEQLQRDNPDLAAVQTSNPKLFARIRAAVHEREMNHLDELAMIKRINETIDETFDAALPVAGQAALVRHFRLRQMRLTHFLQVDVRLCADETRPFDNAILPSSYQRDMKQHVMRTVSEPQGPPAAISEIDMAEMFRDAAKSLAITPDQLASRLPNESQARAACEAKLALFKAIDRQPDEAIAAFVRAGLETRFRSKAS